MLLFIPDTLPDDDKQLISKMYEKHCRRMFAAAKQITNDKGDAEDAVQNAFVSIVKNIGRINIDDEEAMRGYLLTVVKNEAVNILRKRKDSEPVDEMTGIADGCDVEFLTEKREVFEYAVKIMSAMDEKYRAPLYLSTVMGFSIKEVAKTLGRDHKTVKVQISRARKMLADALTEAGYEL